MMYFTRKKGLETVPFSMAHGELMPFLRGSNENLLWACEEMWSTQQGMLSVGALAAAGFRPRLVALSMDAWWVGERAGRGWWVQSYGSEGL